MLRSGNELNKPSFSKLRNTNPIGRISKRHCARRKEILRLVNQEYNSYISVSIAEKLIREINEIASYNEQTPEFVDEIREKMFLLHEYNTHVAKIAYTYPTSKEIYELLGRYVALESDVLYKNNCAFKFEKQVENRVFDTIVTFLKDSFSTEEDSLHEERKRVYNEALKVFVSYVDVKYTNDEEKFPARIVKNILDALGLIKKSTDNPSGNLDLNNPSLIRLKESLKDSDYGSDDDGQETASISSESSFRTMLSKRNHEKISKKGIPNDDVVICEISPGVPPTDTPESRVSVQCSTSKSTLTNEETISENLTGESSQSSSIDSRTTLRNDRGLKSLCNSSTSEQPVPNFPSSNEVFSTISPNEIQTFFDFNVDDDIEVIEWSSRKSKFPQPHVNPANNTTQTINKNNNTLSKINTKSVGGNIEYRIFGTISITGSDEEEEDFVYNRTDFDAIKRHFIEQKKSHAILNNLKKRTLEEVSKAFDELDKRKANTSNLAPIKFSEPSVRSGKAVACKEEIIDRNSMWNINRSKGYANRNETCQSGLLEKTENKIERDDASKTITIEISSSDEDEPVMSRKNTDGSQWFPLSITNPKTPLTKTIPHNSETGVKIIENNLEVGNNQPYMMKRIFCRPLDELKTVRNPVVPKESDKQVESSSKRNLPTSGFVDLCSENEFDANDIVNLTTDSDEDDVLNKQKLPCNESISSDQVSSGRDMRYDSFYHSRVQFDGNSSCNNEIKDPVDRINEAQTEKIINVCLGERRLSDRSGSELEQIKPNISIPPPSKTLLKQCSVENSASEHRNNEQSRKVTLVDKQSVSIQTEMEQCEQGEKFECILLGKPYFSSQASSDKTSRICGTDNSTPEVDTVTKVDTDDKNDTKSNRNPTSTENMVNGNEIFSENGQVGHSEIPSVSYGVECSEKESISQSSQYTSTKTTTLVGENEMLKAGENDLISEATENTNSQFSNSPCILSPTDNEKGETGENQKTLPLSPVFGDNEQVEDHRKIEHTEDNITNGQLRSSGSAAQIEEQIIDGEEIGAETTTSTTLTCSVRTCGQLKIINEKLDSGEKITNVDVDLIHSSLLRSQNEDSTVVAHVTKPFDEEEVILNEEDQIFEGEISGASELKETSALSSVINDGVQDTYERGLHLEQDITTLYNQSGEEVIETTENQEGQPIEIQHTTEEVSSSCEVGPTNIILGCGQKINSSIEPTEIEKVAVVSGEENFEQLQAEKSIVSIENEGTSKDLLCGQNTNLRVEEVNPIGSGREKENIEQFPCEKSTKSVESQRATETDEILGYDRKSTIMQSIEEEFAISFGKEKEKIEHLQYDKSIESIENQGEIQTHVVLGYDQKNTIMQSIETGKVQFENSTDTVHNQVEVLSKTMEQEEAPVVAEQEEEGEQFQSESITESIDEGKDSSEMSINEVIADGERSNTIRELLRVGYPPEMSEKEENIKEKIRSKNSSEYIDNQREVSSDMTVNEVLGYSPMSNPIKESTESQTVPVISEQKEEMNELVQSNNPIEAIDNQDKVPSEIEKNEVLGEKSNPTMESLEAEAVSLVQVEMRKEPEDINFSPEITYNEKHASIGHDNNQTDQLLDANQFDKGLLDSVINQEMINSSMNDNSSIKSFTTQTTGSDQMIAGLKNNEQITGDPNFLNNDCSENETKTVEKNPYAEETVECSDKSSEVQYHDRSMDDSQSVLDCEPGRQSTQKSEKDLFKNTIPPTETNKSNSDEQMSPENFGATNEWLDDEQGKQITSATEKIAEDDTSQEKIMYDDECTSFVIDEGEINDNMENVQEEMIMSHSDTETNTGPAKCDSKIQNPEESIVIDKNFDKCEFITLHSAKELEISTTVYTDSLPVPTSIAVEKDECFVRKFPLTTIVEKYSKTSDYTPVEENTRAITNTYPDDSVDMEIEVPFNSVPDESKEIELTPKARKSRCSDSHNVVGNLGKVMLLMSNNEPRRPKRNIFTSPIKVNDNCVIFDTSPTTSSKSIIDVGTRDPPYNSYTDLECNSTTKVSTFSEETLSQLQNTLYSSNNFYSSYIPKDTRDKEVFLNIKECISEKQQLDIDILASVASSQKPLKVNVHQTDKKVNVSNSSRNKRSPSIKSTESKSNPPIKKSSCASPLETNSPSIISPTNTPQNKNKSKSSKSNIKTPKSEKKSNSPTSTPTSGRKAKISKNKKTESKLPETETKEEIKKSKKGGRKSKEEGEDKKNLKGSKMTEKSRTKQINSEKELIIDSSESDDSLPLNVRMKKSPVENTSAKSSRKDSKMKNNSKVCKSKEKSKKALKKRNEEKRLIIDCTQEKELDAKTQIISDKLDKHKVTSPPVKEDPSRRIVHFKKAMLELISLDENNGKNVRMNESGEVQKPLISCDDNENGQSRTFQDTNYNETARNQPSSSIHVDNKIIIEPNIWNSPPEVIVEYKELAGNNSSALEKQTEDSSTSRVSDTSNNSPIVENIPRSDNNLGDIRNSFISDYVLPYVCDESRLQEAIEPAVLTITIEKNIAEGSETACSNSNTIVDDPMQTNISSAEVSIESLSRDCSETKMDIIDSRSLEKQSENEIKETEENIEKSKHHREENDTIEKIDNQEQVESTKNEYDEIKYPSLNSKEPIEPENTIDNQTHNILDIKIEKCCEKNKIENVDEKNIKHGAEACRSSDLKISLEIPDTILDLKSSELIKSEENLHRSSKDKLKIKNELSTPRNKKKSKIITEPENKDLNVHKEFDNTISLGDEKQAVVVRNEKEEILADCTKNETLLLSDAEPHQSILPLSSAQDLEQKKKNIPTEKEGKVSSCTVMKKENYRKKSKKTRNLYDTKKDIIQDGYSSIENISKERKEKKKESSKVKQNIDKFGKKQEHKISMKDQENNCKEILSEPFILLEKLSTQEEKNKEKIEGKTGRLKRKRSDSETSEKIRSSSKYIGSTTETHKEIKRGCEKHKDKLAKTEIKDEKLLDSESKHEGRTHSRRNRKKSVKSKLSNQCVGEPKSAFSATKNTSGPENENPEVELLRNSSNTAADTTHENNVIEQKQQIELLENNKISIIMNQCEEEFNAEDISRTISSDDSSKNSEGNEDTKLSATSLSEAIVDPKDDDTCVANKNECSLSIDDENDTEKHKKLSTFKSDFDSQEKESLDLVHLTPRDSGDKDDGIRNLCFKFGDVTLKPMKSYDVLTDGKKCQEIDEDKSQLASDTRMEECQAQPHELEKKCGSIMETKLDKEVVGNETEGDLAAIQNPIHEIEISTNVEIEAIPHQQSSQGKTVIQDIVPEIDDTINTAESKTISTNVEVEAIPHQQSSQETTVIQDIVPAVDDSINTAEGKTESCMETTLDQQPLEFVDHTGGDMSNSSNPILEIEISSNADNEETKLNEQVSEQESVAVSRDEASKLYNSIDSTNDEQESTMETKLDPHASKFVADRTERKMSVDLNPTLEIETSMNTEEEKPYPKAGTKPNRKSLEFVKLTEECISMSADLRVKSENSKNETAKMETKLDQQPSELGGEGGEGVLDVGENPVVEIEISTTAENEETKMDSKNKQQLLESEKVTEENIAVSPNRISEIEIKNDEACSKNTAELNEQFLDSVEVPQEDLSVVICNQESGMDMDLSKQPPTTFVVDEAEVDMIASQNPCFEVEISSNAGNQAISSTGIEEMKAEFEGGTEESAVDQYPVIEINNAVDSSNDKEESTIESKLDSQSPTFVDESEEESRTRVLEIEISTATGKEETCNKMETNLIEQTLKFEEVHEENISVDQALTQIDRSTQSTVETTQLPSKFIGDEIEREVVVSQNPVLEIAISTNNEIGQACPEIETKIYKQNVEFEQDNEGEMGHSQDMVLERRNLIPPDPSVSGMDQPSSELVDTTEEDVVVRQSPAIELEIFSATENVIIESEIDHQTTECVKYDNDEDINLPQNLTVDGAICPTNENSQQQPSEISKDEIEGDLLVCQNPVLEIEVSTNAEYEEIPSRTETTLSHQSQQFEDITKGNMTSQDKALDSKTKLMDNSDSLDVVEEETACRNIGGNDLKADEVQEPVIEQTVEIEFIGEQSNSERDSMKKQMEESSSNSSERLIINTSIDPPTLPDMNQQEQKMFHTEVQIDVGANEVSESPKNKRKRRGEIDEFIVIKKCHIENEITKPSISKVDRNEEKINVSEQFCHEKQKHSILHVSPQANEILREEQNSNGAKEEREKEIFMVSAANSQDSHENNRPKEVRDYQNRGNNPLKHHIESIVGINDPEIPVTKQIPIVNTKSTEQGNVNMFNYTEKENIIGTSGLFETGEIQFSDVKENSSQDLNQTKTHTSRDDSSSLDALEGSDRGLNLKIYKNVEGTAENNIEETITEQIVQHPTSIIKSIQSTSVMTKSPKNELSFSIERMLKPSPKNQPTPAHSATVVEISESVIPTDTGREQTSISFANDNKQRDMFKHPEIMNINKSDSKQNKISSSSDNQRKKKNKKKEKSKSTLKVEENRKVIVERVYSMNELAGGTKISPCLNLCSAPISPISTEFIPYRYGIYSRVNPSTEMGHSFSNPAENGGLPSYHPPDGAISHNEYTPDSPAKHKGKNNDLSHSEESIKDAGDIHKVEPKTLKSENDIEIVQVEGPNREFEMKVDERKNAQLKNDGNIQRFISEDNVDDESIRLKEKNSNGVKADVDQPFDSSLTFHSEVQQVDNSMRKSDDEQKLQSSGDDDIASGCSKRSFEYGMNIEPRVKTIDTRKSIESIVSCLKSKESDKKAEFHSNDQTKRLSDKLEKLYADKEMEIRASSNIEDEVHQSKSSCLNQSDEINNIAPPKILESNIGRPDSVLQNINQKPDITGQSNRIKPTSIPSYDVEGADDIVTDELEATRTKSTCGSTPQSHKIETSKVGYPQSEVSPLFNTNLEQQDISDSFVNQVIAQSSGSEGIDSLLTSFQSAINESIAQNISSLQGSFSLFSNSSDDNIPFTPPNQVHNEGMIQVNFQDKAVLPLSQPEVFINNRLNIPQSTPLRPQGTSQTDDSIFNISDDIFDFDFNTVNQATADGSYSNSYVNTTMTNDNLQMIFDNPSELLHLLYNFNDVGCEVTVDNTNEDIPSNTSIAPGLIQEQLIDSIPPYIAEEEFDSNAPTDPMVGGQKELVPDPKQDPNLDEAPFPESALSFDEDMMHRYALFLHCDVNSTTQSSDVDGLNKEKVSREPENTPVRHDISEKQHSENELARKVEDSEAAMGRKQNLASVPQQDTKVVVKDDFSNCNISKITEQPQQPGSHKREMNKQPQSKSPKISSPNNSTDSQKSTKKANGKNPGKVQKIPASKYAPPKKPKSDETHPNKKTQEKVEVKQPKYSASNEKVGNLTLDIDFNHSLDMPQLLSPTGNTSWKSKSLPTSHNNRNESKTGESERRETIAQSTPDRTSEDDSNQQMQFNMYDRTKAMKRNAARVQNYFKFYDEGDNSSSKNKKRKVAIKTEQPVEKPNVPSNSPKVPEHLEPKDAENKTKLPKIEDSLPVTKESVIKKPVPVEISQKSKNPYVRDLDYEFDKLKNSGPYKSSSSKNVGNTRTDRILRSAQEGDSSHYQMPPTSSQYNYNDRGKREDYRRYPDSYRKVEDSRRKPKDRSRSPHHRSSAYASTSSDYRRESSRRPTQQEMKRNDSSHGRNPQTCSEERRRTLEAHHPRDPYKKVNRWLKRDCPDYPPPGPLFNRPYSNQSQQKKDSKRGDEYLEILDELYPLERNVYQNTGR